MRVLAGPRIDLDQDGTEARVARALAGLDGAVVSLGQVGVNNLSRPLTQAEVALLREALLAEGTLAGGSQLAAEIGRAGAPAVVGYVCKGVALEGV